MDREAFLKRNRIYQKKYRDKTKDKRKTYREAHKEESKAYMKAWREENKEIIKKKYREKREYHLSRRRIYYYDNHEYELERRKKYREENPEKEKASKANQNGKRRAKIKETDITSGYLLSLWQQTKKCCLCDKALTPKCSHLDHIIPLNNGGKHIKKNVRYICSRCNQTRPHDGRDLNG